MLKAMVLILVLLIPLLVFIKDHLVYIENDIYNSKNNVCVLDVFHRDCVKKYKVDFRFEGFSLWGDVIEENIFYGIIGPYIMAINIDDGRLIWHCDMQEPLNYFFSGSLICGNVLFLGGDNMYMAMDKKSGKILYKQKKEGCKWFVENSGYIYANILGQIYILELSSGRELARIICPEEKITGEFFNTGIVASFYGNQLFVMSYTSVYCYPAYPWNK